jgi:uncharacterized cupin superfamily protein
MFHFLPRTLFKRLCEALNVVAMPKITVRKPTPAEAKEAESWDIWEKEPSEFDWEYSAKETCLILEGLATVEGKDGQRASFSAGEKIRKRYRFG